MYLIRFLFFWDASQVNKHHDFNGEFSFIESKPLLGRFSVTVTPNLNVHDIRTTRFPFNHRQYNLFLFFLEFVEKVGLFSFVVRVENIIKS